jgi:hypothetical protein
MKRKNNVYLCIIGLFIAIIFINCKNNQKYEFICQNTLSIFLLNNGTDYYFSIPIQYIGDYKIGNFEYDNGYVLIGDYKILLKKDNIKISVYYNEDSDDIQSIVDYLNKGNNIDFIAEYFKVNTYGSFKLIFLEENNKILISKIDEILLKRQEVDNEINQYNIYIERILNNNDIKYIINEFIKGNTYSKLEVWFDITIDNELMKSGIIDDFEIYIKDK